MAGRAPAIRLYGSAGDRCFFVQPREFLRQLEPRARYGTGGAGPKRSAMFYVFRRGAASIRCEVRTDSGGEGYELIVDRPDAMVSIERFGGPPELNSRWQEIERMLIREGWHGPQVQSR
ncbi:MAG: hypothetical protein ACRD1V_16745 [Vicinamibacterales bacterium]